MANSLSKILFLTLNTFSSTGGIEKVNRALAKVLSDLKITQAINSFDVISMYDELPDEKYIPVSNFKGFNGNRFSFAISAFLKGQKADTIILSHINLLVFASLIKKTNPKARIILLAHGIEVWRTLANWKIKLLQHTEIWAVSNFTAAQLTKHQIPQTNIKVLNNCLDPYFDPKKSFSKPDQLLKKYKLSSSQPVLFTLTRLSSAEQYKGYDQVLNVLAKLNKTYPTLRYILAGKADEIEESRILNLISLNKIEEQVILTGYLADEEVQNHYHLADVFVMPSKGEGFGISFIEAIACGCAVIGGNKDGSTDALLNGDIGTLINPDDEKALEFAILEVLGKNRSDENSTLLQEKCLANFSYEKYKKNVSELLIINTI